MKLFSDRIFVYSPKGDIYDLPRGAFPLDYAYRIHSDIAARASGFKINGVMKHSITNYSTATQLKS